MSKEKTSEAAGKSATTTGTGTPTPEGMISAEPRISSSLVEGIITEVETAMDDFMKDVDIDTNMTGRERQRLFGVKSRNYGFISKARDIARDNPGFLPPNFSLPDMLEHVRIFEQVRQLTIVLEQFQHLATDYLMLTSDNAYRDALRIYGSLREQSRSRVAGAAALYDELLQYFTLHRHGRPGDEPTDKELERDFHSLIHGRKDGEMVIKNEAPHASGGVHTVIDDVHKGHGAEFKGTVEGEVEN